MAFSTVRTVNATQAALVLVLSRGGTTAKMVARYQPSMSILSMVVPEIKTENFQWLCSDESPARHSLIYKGLVLVLSEGSANASHTEATKEALVFALEHAKEKGLCKVGDSVVSLHMVGASSVNKILVVK